VPPRHAAPPSGQRVEIVTAKSGGPSRDWLNAERGFVKSARARAKIRQWFNAEAHAESVAAGRAIVEKELKRERATQASLDALAQRLGFKKPDELFSPSRATSQPRQLQTAVRGFEAPRPAAPKVKARPAAKGGVLVVGRHGPADGAARQVLQAGAARSDPRLRHARQGRLGPPRRLRQLKRLAELQASA